MQHMVFEHSFPTIYVLSIICNLTSYCRLKLSRITW